MSNKNEVNVRQEKRALKPYIIFALGIVLLLAVVLIVDSLRTNFPAARYGAKMIFDPVGKRAILFGGRGKGFFDPVYFNDLWAFDHSKLSWTPIKTTTHPPGRLAPGLVYDPDRQQIILFGGLSQKERLNDTWIYDFSDNRWIEVRATNNPPARSDMGMVYDDTHHVAILFGGYCQDETRDLCNDTWIFDPVENNWTEMDPIYSPPIIYGQAMVYDAANQQVLLWGGHMSANQNGQVSSIGYDDRLWLYDYSTNTWEVQTQLYRPPARYWHQAIMNTRRDELLVFSGKTYEGYLNDTWIFDIGQDSWRRIDSLETPLPRVNPSMVYDPVHQIVILFGGVEDDFNDLGDTWLYKMEGSGGQWTLVPYQ